MKPDYDLIVIGGGAAGLVAATGGAMMGAKTALIEKNKLGGDCTWYGCIPSKALLKASQVFSLLKHSDKYGISSAQGAKFDTDNVMPHVRSIIKEISSHHPAGVFEKKGIKVLFGAPKFVDNKTILLDGKRMSAKRFIICTGSHPMVPPIEGLKDIDYLTNENIFDLEALPESITVLGGGPIGIELSQALARLGVKVSIVEMFDRILFREDEELARVLRENLVKDGVKIYAGKKAVKFSKNRQSVTVTIEDKDKKLSTVTSERVLVAVGRSANVRGLDLEKAGVKYSNKGIEADKTLKTDAPNIYAAGDIVGPYQFSHIAEYQAIIALGNALLPFKRAVDYGAVPWCTFTEPELAHLGLTEVEARSQYKNVNVYRSQYSANDRAVTDLQKEGMAKVICDKKGKILGAHIVGANAGELIHEYVLAKSAKLSIDKLSSSIHIYPTLSQVVKSSADQRYMSVMSSGWFKAMMKFFIKILR